MNNSTLIKIMKITNLITTTLLAVLILSCSAPGVQAPKMAVGFSGNNYYLDNDDKLLNLVEIDESNVFKYKKEKKDYLISTGDKLNVTVWGLQEIFPTANFGATSNPITTRTVNSNGEIFFPYIGKVKVSGTSIEYVRELITNGLSKQFNNPQVDVTIVEFNENRTVYVVGEILVPLTFKIGLEDISLMSALGQSKGLDPKTASGSSVYVLRNLNNSPEIFRFDLSTSDKFLVANNFDLEPGDVIYVGPSNITKWNRVVAQLFPFSSFLNQLDLISNRN